MQEIWFHIDKIQAAMKNMSIEERGMTVQAIAEAAARDDIKFLEQFDFVSIKEPAETARTDNHSDSETEVMLDQDKTFGALICIAYWWIPSLGKRISKPGNIRVSDWPANAEFITNHTYSWCGLPGEVWDEHADNHDDKPGWLCRWHANNLDTLPSPMVRIPHASNDDDDSLLPVVTMKDLIRD